MLFECSDPMLRLLWKMVCKKWSINKGGRHEDVYNNPRQVLGASYAFTDLRAAHTGAKRWSKVI
jgi:hypothetical protein